MANEHEDAKEESLPPDSPWARLTKATFVQYFQTQKIPKPTTGLNRSDYISVLEARGISPNTVFLNFSPTSSPSPPCSSHSTSPSVDLPRQHQGEEVDAYLRRALHVFTQENTPEKSRVSCLLSMTQPDVSEAATLLYEQGQTTFHELAASLRAQFNKSRFDYLQRFQSLVPHANETYVNYGCRLREAYLKYLPAPPGNLPSNEALITHALIGQFLTTIQGAIASHMQGRALAEPNVTWKQFCTYADEFRLTHPHARVIINRGPTANQPIRKPNAQRPSSASGASSSSGSTDRRMHFCIHHDRMAAHTSEECSIHTGQPPPAHFCEKHRKSRGRKLHGPGKRESRAVTAVLCTVPTPQAAQDRITLLISIKDQKCTALIDTGASKSFIAAEVAQSLNLPTNPVAASIAVAVTNISLPLNQSIGTCDLIHSDRAAVFFSNAYKRFIRANQIEVHIAQPSHPEGEQLYRERSPSLSSGPTASPATDSAPSATQEMDLDCDDDSLLAAEDALYLEESGGLAAIDLFDEEALLADPPGAEEDVTST